MEYKTSDIVRTQKVPTFSVGYTGSPDGRMISLGQIWTESFRSNRAKLILSGRKTEQTWEMQVPNLVNPDIASYHGGKGN